MVSRRGVGLLGSTSNHLVGNHLGSSLRRPESVSLYKPEWKIKGSLWRSSANSKKALSGFTALRRFDQSGIAFEFKTKSLLIEERRLDP